MSGAPPGPASAGAAPGVPQSAFAQRLQGEVTDGVDPGADRERVAQQGVEAFDARGHPAGGHALDLVGAAELGPPGEVVGVGGGVGRWLSPRPVPLRLLLRHCLSSLAS